MTSTTMPSCAGYVTKRGKIMNSWKLRYFVLEGTVLRYYESKQQASTSKSSKAEIEYSSVEKENFPGGVFRGKGHPHGLKFIGNQKGRGYVEIWFYVESAADQLKWLEVAKQAIVAARPGGVKSIQSREAEILGTSTWPGIPGTFPTNESEQSQIDHSRSKKDDLIHHALQDILETKEVSNDVCQELQVQSDMLKKANTDLDEASAELDHGDFLLQKMKNPFSSILTSHKRHQEHHEGKGGFFHHHHSSSSEKNDHQKGAHQHASASAKGEEMDELALLSQVLSELESQAQEINHMTISTTDQIDSVSSKTARVHDRVQSQSQRAKDISHKGTLF